ncbi:MAG: thiamine monophosphate synthase [Alphaproteobacteria bacterium]|nr:thiamine monophosphate synthase [Alphaproteobacteria bacterium]
MNQRLLATDGPAQLLRVGRALRQAAGNPVAANGGALPPLILVTDAARVPDPLPAAGRLPEGSAVLLRHYGWPQRQALAEALAKLCRTRGVLLLIGADADLAREVGADGLHLREAMLDAPPPRRPGIVTAAVHSAAAVAKAAAIGADAVLAAPVFETTSHPGRVPLGIAGLRAIVQAGRLPVFALGGVSALNAETLLGSGAAGIAAVGALAD